MAPSVSPLNWTGNKSCIYDMISGFMPEHTVYIEPCMGSAEVFLRKKPAKKEIINDYNGDLVNFFRVLQSTPHLPELIGRLYLSFHSEEMFKRNQKLLAETPNLLDDVFDMLNIVCEITSKDVERAAAFFQNQVYSFSSMGTSFAIAPKDITSKFPKLRAASNRLRDAIIMHRDYKDVIRDQSCVGAFILLDPPYKGTEGMYKKSNFDANEHDNLFELMNGVHDKFGGQCKFLITYNNDPYIRSLADHYGFDTFVQDRLHNMAQGSKPGAMFEELLIANYDLQDQATKNHFYYPQNCKQLGLFEYNPDY